MRQDLAHRIRKGTGAISTDYLNFWMTGQPRLDRLSGAVGQEIKWPSRLQVAENRSLGVCPSEGKIINAQPSDLGEGSVFDGAQVARASSAL